MDRGEWYLEVNGKKVGPFTLEQIQGLLDDGEIRPYHQVTSTAVGGRWQSVEELLETQAPPAPVPSDVAEVIPEAAAEAVVETTEPFQPPPRPEIQAQEPSATQGERTDPALSLFDALQVVRERQTAKLNLTELRARTRNPLLRAPSIKLPDMAKLKASLPKVRIPAEFPMRVLLASIFGGIVLGALSYGVVKLLRPKTHPAPGSLTQVNSLHPTAPPATAYTPEPKRVIPPPQTAPRITAPISRPAVEYNANTRPPEPPPQQLPPEQNPYRDPNYPQDPNQQQPNVQPPVPPQGGMEMQQYDQYGNPIAPPPPPIQPNPAMQGQPGQPQGDPGGQINPNDPNQLSPGAAPGQDAFPQQQPQ